MTHSAYVNEIFPADIQDRGESRYEGNRAYGRNQGIWSSRCVFE